MPKKKGDKNITKPICQGMPSKIYLLAYGGKLHPYKIAEILKFGWEAPSAEKRKKSDAKNYRVYPSQVYREIKRYPKLFFYDTKEIIDEKGAPRKLLKTYPDPLIREMESELNEKIDKDTRVKLLDFFDSYHFRNYIYDYAINQAKKGIFEEDVDSFGSIMVMTSYISRLAFQIKKSLARKKIPLEDFKKKWKKISRKLERKGITPDFVQSVISEYSPSDIKNKFPEKVSDPKKIFDLSFRILDLDFLTLEKLMKMGYTYETLTLVDAGLMAVPELIDMVRKER